MKLSFAAVFFAAATLAAFAQTPMPRMASAEPQNGKVGDTIVITGENLQKEAVAKVFLTDGNNDVQVEVSEQTSTSLKIKIPAKVKAGRLALMVLTGGKEPKLIEQPVKVTIDE